MVKKFLTENFVVKYHPLRISWPTPSDIWPSLKNFDPPLRWGGFVNTEYTHTCTHIHVHIYMHNTCTIHAQYMHNTCTIHARIHTVHTYMHTYACTYAYTHTHTRIHTCTHMQHAHTCTHTHTYIYTYMHTHAHTYMHTHAHTYMHTTSTETKFPELKHNTKITCVFSDIFVLLVLHQLPLLLLAFGALLYSKFVAISRHELMEKLEAVDMGDMFSTERRGSLLLDWKNIYMLVEINWCWCCQVQIF